MTSPLPCATGRAARVLFETVQAVLEPRSWKTFAADGRDSAWKLLAAPPPGFGCAVVGIEGEKVVEHVFRSGVVRASFSVRLTANILPNPNTLPQPFSALHDMADRVKAAILASSLPRGIVPESPAVAFRYEGASPFQPPAGKTLDAIEQRWSAELAAPFEEPTPHPKDPQ